jgi:hypothetical protein
LAVWLLALWLFWMPFKPGLLCLPVLLWQTTFMISLPGLLVYWDGQNFQTSNDCNATGASFRLSSMRAAGSLRWMLELNCHLKTTLPAWNRHGFWRESGILLPGTQVLFADGTTAVWTAATSLAGPAPMDQTFYENWVPSRAVEIFAGGASLNQEPFSD